MADVSTGGALAAWAELCRSRSIHSEAQARYRACPWSLPNLRDLDSAESRLLVAVDAYIAASGGKPPRKVF